MNSRVGTAGRPSGARALLRIHHRRVRELLRKLSRRAGPEEVHKARVAVRRLRTILASIAPAIEPRDASRLREQFRGLAHELGMVRDADIRAQILLPALSTLGQGADGRSAAALARRLRAARHTTRRRLRAHLRSAAFHRELEATRRLVADDALLRPGTDADKMLRAALQRRRRKLDKALAGKVGSAARRHALRIRIKKFRYLRDALHGRPARADKQGRRLRQLQEDLGRLNDLAQARRWLKQQEPDTHLVRLLGKHLRSRKAKALSHLGKSWRG